MKRVIWLSLVLLLPFATSIYGQSKSLVNILDIRSTSDNHVEMVIAALDEQGNPIKGVSKEQLSLSIDGKNVTEFSVEPISNAKNPISVVLAIDTSGSMQGRPIVEAKKAASVFLDQLDKEDFTSLMSFGSSVRSLGDFSKEKYRIREKIESLSGNEQLTWLYQATDDAIEMALKAPTSRVAVILLTDGKDEGSPKKEEEVLKRLRSINVPVYTLGFGPAAQIEYLKNVASISGGYYLYTPKAEELTALYSMVLDQLKNQYLIKFNFASRPGDYACVLTMDHKGVQLSARKSFLFASNTGTSELGARRTEWFKSPLLLIPIALAILFVIAIMIRPRRVKPSDVQKTKADVSVMINGKIHPLTFTPDNLDGTATVIYPTSPKGEVVLQIETKPLPIILSLTHNVVAGDIKELILARYNEKESALYVKDKVYLLFSNTTISRPDSNRLGHARLFLDKDTGIYRIEDLGSVQGTKINDSASVINRSSPLKSGDSIAIGSLIIKYFDQRPLGETRF